MAEVIGCHPNAPYLLLFIAALISLQLDFNLPIPVLDGGIRLRGRGDPATSLPAMSRGFIVLSLF